MVYLDKNYLKDESQVVVGASYKVCDDLDKLYEVWSASKLGHFERHDLRQFLNKIVKASETRLTQQADGAGRQVVPIDPGVVKCKSAKGDVLYFPVQCLSRVDTLSGDAVDPSGNKIKETAGAKKPEYFTDMNDIKEGEYYRITSSLERLKVEWTKCHLEIMNISRLRSLLRKFVKVEKLEPDFNACLCSGDHENDLTYIPFNCLLNPTSREAGATKSSKKPPKPKDSAGSITDSGYMKFADVVRGRRYKVTKDINHLREYWEKAGLDAFVELEYFLKVDGRCTDLDMHDETVKLTWKTGSEEEWFPAQVLTVSYSKGETSSSSKSNTQKNRMNVGEEAANVAQQRNMNMDYLDQAYKSSGIEYLRDAKDAVRERQYKVTGDIARMERYWRESGFEDVERDFLRRYLERQVRVIQIEIADQSCHVRLEDTMDNVWLPAQVLMKISTDDKQDRRRPEQNAVLLRTGDNVRLVRVARSDYENCRGRLVQYLEGKQKWRVHLEYWDKVVLVRASNIEKERTDNGVQNISNIQLGSYYQVTTDYQLLVHSLEEMGERVDNDSIESLVEVLGEMVYAKSIDPSSKSVECVFNEGTSKSLPFSILYQVPGERERPQEDGEDIRDLIGYL